MDWFWPEGFYALAMLAAFALGVFALSLPVAIAMCGSAVIGAALAGFGLPLRHLVEGMFGYIDTILIIATAMIFMNAVQSIGLMDAVAAWIIRRFRRSPFPLACGVMFLIMLPGMLTGSSTACCLTTGALVAPVLMKLGVPSEKTAAFIALGAVLGMVAPPINIPVMIIGGGIDMPYVGFAVPLLIATVPVALLVIAILALPHLRRNSAADPELERELERELARMEEVPLTARLFLPFVVLIVLMLGEQTLPGVFPSLGMPLQFLLASASAFLAGRRWNALESATDAVRDAIPVLGILMGVGMFVQIMTLTGVRGFVVVSALAIPSWLLYVSIATTIPAFGAISSFGAASVLGVPFILALLSRDQILVATGLALISGLGDLVPPTALAGIFAAQVTGVKNYFAVLKHCLIPSLAIALWGIAVILLANPLAALLR
ncbi:MAG: TRAP transporter large permease subunit [Synergistaceae bacterium]|jgi:TRAP-type C4-dicarboxylate transport system permease large subunit|nr:TRAP transporter large permease subunit [Synergistaceae bacterium]